MYALEIVSLLLFAYAAYWALYTRKALAVRMYRNQALGVASVSIAFGLLIAESLAGTVLEGPGYQPGAAVVDTALLIFLVFFYWVDASAVAARRSDPLLRDIFHWRRVRNALWGIQIITYSSYFIVAALTRKTPGLDVPTGLDPILTTLFNLVSIFRFPMAIIPFVSGIIILPIGARRSGDFVLRKHLQWFGLTAAAIFVAGLINNFFPPLTFPFLIVSGYCLYRSAKSLAPLNKLLLG